jgi:hypothetical protein
LNISETRIPLPATGPIAVQDPSARLQVIIDYKGNRNDTLITDTDFAAWGSPVVNTGQKNTYIAWASREGIGVVAKPYRDRQSVTTRYIRIQTASLSALRSSTREERAIRSCCPMLLVVTRKRQ